MWLTGDIREMCYALKTFQIPKNEYIDLYNQTLSDLEVAYVLDRNLPAEVDMEFVNDTLVNFYLNLLGDTLQFRILSANASNMLPEYDFNDAAKGKYIDRR